MQLDAGRIGASGWPFLCKEKLFAEGGNFPSSGAGLTEDSVPEPPRAWSAVTSGLFLSRLRSDQRLLPEKNTCPDDPPVPSPCSSPSLWQLPFLWLRRHTP